MTWHLTSWGLPSSGRERLFLTSKHFINYKTWESMRDPSMVEKLRVPRGSRGRGDGYRGRSLWLPEQVTLNLRSER